MVGVLRVAVLTPKMTSGSAHENRWPSGPRRFALNAEKDFIDFEHVLYLRPMPFTIYIVLNPDFHLGRGFHKLLE